MMEALDEPGYNHPYHASPRSAGYWGALELTPGSGVRIMLTARVFIDHQDTKALLGLWPTQSNRFDNRPANGVFFEDAEEGPPPGYFFSGTAIVGTGEQSTGDILALRMTFMMWQS
jgi:hypothetical protein